MRMAAPASLNVMTENDYLIYFDYQSRVLFKF